MHLQSTDLGTRNKNVENYCTRKSSLCGTYIAALARVVPGQYLVSRGHAVLILLFIIIRINVYVHYASRSPKRRRAHLSHPIPPVKSILTPSLTRVGRPAPTPILILSTHAFDIA